jgi:hypothetical protein
MTAEYLNPSQLKIGNVYFRVEFVDRERTIPRLTPWVFAGRDLDGATRGDLFFQDYESYRRGAKFDSASSASFEIIGEADGVGVFEFERALDYLQHCVGPLGLTDATPTPHPLKQ